jgi:hypothetical protein
MNDLLHRGLLATSGGPIYCTDCARLKGYLGFLPSLRTTVNVYYIEYPRPRRELVTPLGSNNQSVPALIIAQGRRIEDPTLPIKLCDAVGSSTTNQGF